MFANLTFRALRCTDGAAAGSCNLIDVLMTFDQNFSVVRGVVVVTSLSPASIMILATTVLLKVRGSVVCSAPPLDALPAPPLGINGLYTHIVPTRPRPSQSSHPFFPILVMHTSL